MQSNVALRAVTTVGEILSFNRAGWSLSMVAFGNRKDFLQFLRMVHFLRKCNMRKNCKRDSKVITCVPHPTPKRDMTQSKVLEQRL